MNSPRGLSSERSTPRLHEHITPSLPAVYLRISEFSISILHCEAVELPTHRMPFRSTAKLFTPSLWPPGEFASGRTACLLVNEFCLESVPASRTVAYSLSRLSRHKPWAWNSRNTGCSWRWVLGVSSRRGGAAWGRPVAVGWRGGKIKAHACSVVRADGRTDAMSCILYKVQDYISAPER